MTFQEMAWEFVDVFENLDNEQINQMLAKNVPYETLEFAAKYASEFASDQGIREPVREQLPNLILIGYLLKVLEERLRPEQH